MEPVRARRAQARPRSRGGCECVCARAHLHTSVLILSLSRKSSGKANRSLLEPSGSLTATLGVRGRELQAGMRPCHGEVSPTEEPSKSGARVSRPREVPRVTSEARCRTQGSLRPWPESPSRERRRGPPGGERAAGRPSSSRGKR